MTMGFLQKLVEYHSKIEEEKKWREKRREMEKEMLRVRDEINGLRTEICKEHKGRNGLLGNIIYMVRDGYIDVIDNLEFE